MKLLLLLSIFYVVLSSPVDEQKLATEKFLKSILKNTPDATISLLAQGNPTNAQILAAAGVETTFSREVLPTKSTNRTINSALKKELRYMQNYASAAYCHFYLETWKCAGRWYFKNKGLTFGSTATPETVFVEAYRNFFGTDTISYVAYNPNMKAIIVAFRGTHSIQQIVVDLCLDQVTMANTDPKLNIKCHKGFQMGYDAVRMKIRVKVQELLALYPGSHIRTVGHSLGGSFAILSAFDLSFILPSETSTIKIYTYGMPRSGNPEFAALVDRTFKNRIYRVTARRDLVPSLPPPIFSTGTYKHPFREYFINEQGTTEVCSASNSEDSSCSKGQYSLESLNSVPKLFSMVTKPSTPLTGYLNHLFGYDDLPFGFVC